MACTSVGVSTTIVSSRVNCRCWMQSLLMLPKYCTACCLQYFACCPARPHLNPLTTHTNHSTGTPYPVYDVLMENTGSADTIRVLFTPPEVADIVFLSMGSQGSYRCEHE